MTKYGVDNNFNKDSQKTPWKYGEEHIRKIWIVPQWSQRQLKLKQQVGPGVLESTQRSERESWTSFPHKLREKNHGGEHTPCDAQEPTRGVSHCGLAIYIKKVS